MWQYETDQEPKRKHHWTNDYAGWVEIKGLIVSKCPSGMSHQEAEEMLNMGIPWNPKGWIEEYPQRIYAVRGGVIYRATPTNPGKSYHGFPEHSGSLPPHRDLRDKLLCQARAEGTEAEVKKWMQW